MLLDVHGRPVRRRIGYLREYVLVDEPQRQVDLVAVASERVELEEEYLALEECAHNGHHNEPAPLSEAKPKQAACALCEECL